MYKFGVLNFPKAFIKKIDFIRSYDTYHTQTDQLKHKSHF